MSNDKVQISKKDLKFKYQKPFTCLPQAEIFGFDIHLPFGF